MASLWIIDGYNFIRQSRRFSKLEAESPELGKKQALQWLGKFAIKTGETVWVVLDAYSGIHRELIVHEESGVRVLLSRGSYTADEEIAELARQRNEGAFIISSDKEVQKAAVRAGASMLSSEEFEREVSKIFKRFDAQEDGPRMRSRKGDPFQAPKEKKKALARLRKYQ